MPDTAVLAPEERGRRGRRRAVRRRRRVRGAGAAVLVLASLASARVGASAEPALGDVAHATPPPAVGAIFSGTEQEGHDCTGTVVHSTGRDLVITAAHCVVGDGTDLTFVPGYAKGGAPHGAWAVERVYADRRWRHGQDAQHDVAVLQLAHQQLGGRTVGVEDVVGAVALGSAPQAGRSVTVWGYLAGSDDLPVRCTAPIVDVGGPTAFDCDGYGQGTSGGPFLRRVHGRTEVVGVIGGPFQGGCRPWRTYSATFGADQRRLLERAQRGGAGDALPQAGGDGCGDRRA